MPAAPSASVAVERRSTSGRGLVASPDGAAWRPTGSAPGPGDAGTSTGCCRGARGRGRTRCCGASASTPPSWRRCPRGGMSSVRYARAPAPRGDGRPPVRARDPPRQRLCRARRRWPGGYGVRAVRTAVPGRARPAGDAGVSAYGDAAEAEQGARPPVETLLHVVCVLDADATWVTHTFPDSVLVPMKPHGGSAHRHPRGRAGPPHHPGRSRPGYPDP